MKTITPQLDVAIDADNYLGESVTWSPSDQSLYWVNCEQPPALHRWDSRSGAHQQWPMPQRIGGFALTHAGALVALADGLYDFDLASGALDLRVASPMEHASLHECQCDRQGRLWVGGIDHRVSGPDADMAGASLFRLDGDNLLAMETNIGCSNGLAFSPDGRTLYHTDSPTRIINAWDLDPANGAISGKRTFVTLKAGEGFCDGSTVDAEGGYWATIVFGSKLRRYLPDGSLDLEVNLPFAAPTKLAFGGRNLDTLFITTTKMGFPGADNSPMHGGVYSFKPGVRGIEDATLAG